MTLAIEDVESKCIDVVEEVNVGVEGSIGNILVTADILETFFFKGWRQIGIAWFTTTCSCSGKSTQLSGSS